jgi:hypothetical protein
LVAVIEEEVEIEEEDLEVGVEIEVVDSEEAVDVVVAVEASTVDHQSESLLLPVIQIQLRTI